MPPKNPEHIYNAILPIFKTQFNGYSMIQPLQKISPVTIAHKFNILENIVIHLFNLLLPFRPFFPSLSLLKLPTMSIASFVTSPRASSLYPLPKILIITRFDPKIC